MEELRESKNFLDIYGIRIVDLKNNDLRIEMDLKEEYNNAMGRIHGAFIFMLADTAAGVLCIKNGTPCVTMSNSFNFIRSTTDSYIYTSTKLLHRGRSSIVIDVEVYGGESKKIIAKGTFTMFPLPK